MKKPGRGGIVSILTGPATDLVDSRRDGGTDHEAATYGADVFAAFEKHAGGECSGRIASKLRV